MPGIDVKLPPKAGAIFPPTVCHIKPTKEKMIIIIIIIIMTIRTWKKRDGQKRQQPSNFVCLCT
jgi:hypothetical protein